MGTITPDTTTEFNLVATGNTQGITAGVIHLAIYGSKVYGKEKYKFTIDPENVIITDSVIILSLVTSEQNNERYEIQ